MKLKFILFFTFFYSLFLVGNTKPAKTPEIKKGFVENKGQILDQNKKQNANVKFLLNQPGLNVQLTMNGFSYDTYKDSSFHRIDIEFVNGNKHSQIIATEELPGYTNYYLPEAPNGEALNIHSYKKVVYKNIYPNIDIEFFLNEKLNSGFEYNFVLRSGSNIGDIKLKYKGANKIELIDKKIKVSVAHGAFTEEIPKSFIMENGQEIKTDYSLIGYNTFGFVLPQKNISLKGKTLIIDPYPILSWGTYYGGNKYEYLNDVSSDPSGNVMICGYTTSTANIATAGAYQTTLSNPNMDGYLAKFNSLGVIQWATYYGGNCDVQINGMICDNSSNIYFTGQTCANTGISTPGTAQPVFGGGASDAFLVKFSPAGIRTWGTYCGGSFFDWGFDLAIDASGNIFLGGGTNSSNGIATLGSYQSSLSGFGIDAFVAKYNPSGLRSWGSYYGGTGDEYAYGISVLSGGPVLVGSTTSTSSIASPGAFQTTFGGSQDGFLAALDPNGNFRTFGTYYGGTSTETIRRVAVDAGSGIVITGESNSNGLSSGGSFQPNNGGGTDCIIAKFNGSGSRLWGTYYGVPSSEAGRDIGVDASNNIYVAGYSTGLSNTGSYMTTPGAWQRPEGCNGDAFIIKLNSAGARQWSTFYGDKGFQHAFGISVNSGNIFIAGNTSSVSSVLFTAGAYQSITNGGTNDNFLAMFTETATPNPTFSAISGPTLICGNSTYNYSVSPINTAGADYSWAFPWTFFNTPSNIVTTTTSPIPTAGTLSVYTFCDNSITTTLAISVVMPVGGVGTISGNTLVCSGVPATYSVAPAPNATYYIWNLPGGWTGTSTTNIITTIPASSGNVSVTAGNYCGTLGPMTKSITVSSPQLTLNPVSASCFGVCDASLTFTAGGGMAPYSYTPSTPPTGLCAGMYTVYATDNVGCNVVAAANIPQPAPLIISTANTSVTCNGLCNGSYTLNASGGTPAYSFSPSISATGLCAGIYTVNVTDANLCTTTSSVIITEPLVLTSTVVSSSSVICAGSSNTLITNYTGGTPPVNFIWSTLNNTQSIIVNPTITSVYSSTVGDSNGCTSVDVYTLTVNPLPPVTAATSTFCSGTTGCLYGGGATTYTWVGPCAFVSSVQNPCFVYSGACGCTFTCMGTDANGCTNTATVCMNVLPNPTVSTTSSNTLICSGQTSTLTSNGALTYSWSTSATGSTTAVSPTVNTTYTVTGTDANGCMDTDTLTQYVSACTGINENGNYSHFQLYPNPTSGELVLKTELKEDLSIEVYNVLGEIIVQKKITGTETKLNLSAHANGIYFTRIVENGKPLFFSKIIKE